MGHYTGLIVDVDIKDEYIDLFENLTHVVKSSDDREKRWQDFTTAYGRVLPAIYGLSKFPRRNLIFTGLDWVIDDIEPNGFIISHNESPYESGGYSFNGKTLKIRSSLKNYEGELDFFIECVLRPCVSKVRLCKTLTENRSYEENPEEGFVEYLTDLM